ncbi:hypothetical protein EMQU_1703 [Enterococcus mundtii QU 25]|uniref:O-antigen ligase family protein n=1 Tax=Enterococcus mundtii TaxID=53346 RepID=UPI0003C554FF|nr:O-antigen ligase family protein [Enterococcus mundtii]BAO07260.1 hypothetical protein EMQU_1703 [Enterococcus mundtii QU 25]
MILIEGGSGRVDAWETAYRLIIDTHFMGIGFMDYSSVAKVISGSPTIAHNTFLQLAVEWGIGPLVVGLIFLVKQSIIELFNKNWIVVALVLGTIFFSFSISLQNSRILWILLAMLFQINQFLIIPKIQELNKMFHFMLLANLGEKINDKCYCTHI